MKGGMRRDGNGTRVRVGARDARYDVSRGAQRAEMAMVRGARDACVAMRIAAGATAAAEAE